ncbi:MAG: hypothetical protein ABH890_07640 [Bacillota bacterium]
MNSRQELYKESYTRVIEERNAIRGRTDIPLTIFTSISIVLAGIFFGEIFRISCVPLRIIGIIVLFSYILVLMIFAFNFLDFFAKRSILTLPSPNDIEKKYSEYLIYHEAVMKENNPSVLAENDLFNDMIVVYAQCFDDIRKDNQNMLKKLYTLLRILKISLIISVGLVIIIAFSLIL